jgi:hypothetical protein
MAAISMQMTQPNPIGHEAKAGQKRPVGCSMKQSLRDFLSTLPLRDFLSTLPGFKSGRQAGSFSLIKKYRCTWSFSFCFWIALLAAVLCWTGTEQTVIPLTGLVQRTHAPGHAINRSGGPQSFVVTARIRRINPFP